MHNCLVCGTQLDPAWSECGQCQTPVPPSYREAIAAGTGTQSIGATAATATAPAPAVGPALPAEPVAPAPIEAVVAETESTAAEAALTEEAERTPAPEPSAPPRRSAAPHLHRHCLVCGADLEPDWAECGECKTPIPDPDEHHIEVIPVGEGTGETSGPAMLAALCAAIGVLVPLLPFAAVLIGMFAMRDIEDSGGRKGGRVLAQTGMYFGGAVALVHMLLVLFWGPGLSAALTGAGEDTGLGALKQLYKAQSLARFSVAVDTDKDGLGEFIELAALGEGKLPFLRADLADGKVPGYVLMVVLPQSADARERNWWGIAQPQVTSKGWRTFVVDGRGVIRAKDTRGALPDLNTLVSWEQIDAVVSQYDEDVLAAQADVARRQADLRRKATLYDR